MIKVYGTNKEGDGFSQIVGIFDSLEDMKIRVGMYADDVVLEFVEENESEDEFDNYIREIKFRVWDKDLKVMICPEDRESHHWKLLPTGEIWFNGVTEAIPLLNTGLKDMVGKEIYEGDILEFMDKMFVADAEQRKKLQKVAIPDCYEQFSKSALKDYWQVIGNIYENPELLK